MKKDVLSPVKHHAAICGLFCPACKCFIATKEGNEELEELAKMFSCSVEDIRCEGCRSDVHSIYCKTCETVRCSKRNEIDFCIECPDYPCEQLKQFQSHFPHRIELWKSQERIGEVGYEKWYEEMIEHYSCPECQTINSAYDIKCSSCGNEPSCSYVSINLREILKRSKTT
jgi:hypothetical protein